MTTFSRQQINDGYTTWQIVLQSCGSKVFVADVVGYQSAVQKVVAIYCQQQGANVKLGHLDATKRDPMALGLPKCIPDTILI